MNSANAAAHGGVAMNAFMGQRAGRGAPSLLLPASASMNTQKIVYILS
ncbi:hypothetical protein BN2497_8837 [Janthinobacterium sp. CG23_2]|nr:hypothetical protein BN2497_8837 [Janthinobacterium sp. CG23_2]CUU30816.1 hypothetical protein BN3177_8837 [Janthinobacterium sp. CG23_2]